MPRCCSCRDFLTDRFRVPDSASRGETPDASPARVRAGACATRPWGSSPPSPASAAPSPRARPPTGLPLKVSAPCDTPILTVAPSRISPASSICGQRVLHPLLDHALQRPRAIDRVVALVGQPVRAPWRRASSVILRSSSSLRSRSSWMSTIAPMSSRRSRWNRMISSRRLRNSGRKCAAHHVHHLRRAPSSTSSPSPQVDEDTRRRGSRS